MLARPLLRRYIENNKSVEALLPLERWGAILGFTAALTYLTWRGLDVNGATCIALTVIVLAPFVVFSLVGLPQVNPSNWFLGPAVRHGGGGDDDDGDDDGGRRWLSSSDGSGLGGGGGGDEYEYDDDDVTNGGLGDVKWRPLLNILFWNLNYYDSASAFSGDCVEPARTFPRAMALALVFISLTYLVPLAVRQSHSSTQLPRSLTPSLAHSLTHSLAHLLAHSLTHSLTRSLTRSLTHSPRSSRPVINE